MMKLATAPSGGTKRVTGAWGSMLGGRHPSVTYAQYGRAGWGKDNRVFTGGDDALLTRPGGSDLRVVGRFEFLTPIVTNKKIPTDPTSDFTGRG